MTKRFLLIPILLLSLLTQACGASNFASSLRLVVAAGAPVLSIFVQQGKISQEFANALTTDLNEEAGYVQQLGTCFDGIAKDVPKNENKAQHLRCVQTFEGQTRPLLQRHFATNQTVQFIANDIEAILQAAIIYFGGVPAGAPVGTMGAPGAPITEKEINRRIEKLKRDLGQ